jgi:hypothetical protein
MGWLRTVRTAWEATFPFWRYIKGKFQLLPIVGGLAYCSAKDHGKAAKEFLISVAFSTAGFWASVVILRTFKSNSNKSTLDLFLSTIGNGELFIFSVSFLGPILITSLADRKGKREFPGRDWHVFGLIALGILSALLFSLIKVLKNVPISSGIELLDTIDMHLVVQFSIWIAASAVFLRYLTIVYQKSLLTSDELMLNQDAEFARSFAAHRGNIQ